MSLFRKKKDAENDYVDLIFAHSSKRANWDPSITFQAGDFGIISKQGKFVMEGNIYSHSAISEISRRYRPTQGELVGDCVIATKEARSIDVGVSAEVSSKIIYKAGWEFQAESGAVLVLHNSRVDHVPPAFFHEARDLPILKGKMVMHQCYQSCGYYMCLSYQRGEQLTLRLHQEVSPDAGAGANFRWSASNVSGLTQMAYRPNSVETYPYTPLYNLRPMKIK